jgi:hypothetical protein
MSQQGLRQAGARQISLTTTDNPYNEDFMLATAAEVTPPANATYNECMILFCNERLGRTFGNVNEAMQAFAASKGAYNWSSLGTLDT